MRFIIDHHSGEPIYRQIIEQVKYAVAAGQLKESAQLPSIRSLSLELAVNPRTIIKAYEELQHAGLVVMRQGQGVFIAKTQSPAAASERHKSLTDMARRLVAEADRLGASADEIKRVVDEVLKEIDRDKT